MSAHANTVSFASDCSTDGLHKTVTATIVNDDNESETVTRTAETNAVFTPLSVAVAASPDPQHLSTGTMRATVAGSATGAVTLTLHSVWQPDGYSATIVGSGSLGAVCAVPTPKPTPTPAAAVSAVTGTSNSAAVTGVPATGAGPFLQLGGLLVVVGTGLLVAVTRRRHRTER